MTEPVPVVAALSTMIEDQKRVYRELHRLQLYALSDDADRLWRMMDDMKSYLMRLAQEHTDG